MLKKLLWKLRDLKNSLSIRFVFWTIFIVSCMAVSSSFFVEIWLKKQPCFLCQIQRVLYLLLIPVALIGIFSPLITLGKRCCILLLIASCLVSSYHSLVQFKVIRDKCQIDLRINDPESYKSMLLKTNNLKTSCSKISWIILGIPISVINNLISITLLWSLTRTGARFYKNSFQKDPHQNPK